MPFLPIDPAGAEAAPASTLGAPKTSVGETLATLREDVQAALLGREDARIDRWINRAYRDLCSSVKFPELVGDVALSTVVDQPLYLLPSNVAEIQSVSMDMPDEIYGGRPLDSIDYGYYRTLEEGSSGMEPRRYHWTGSVLALHPTPSKSRDLVLRVRVRPEDLEDDTDSPVIPVEWHEAILLGAVHRGHSALKEYQQAAAALNEYVMFVRRREDPQEAKDADRIVQSSVPDRLHHVRNLVRGYRDAD